MNLLIANRGEIAARVALAATVLGTEAVADCSGDDGRVLQVRKEGCAGLQPGKDRLRA